jgi:hypothetical protein
LLRGIPKDPKLIEGWLRGRARLSDSDEIRQAMLRTLAELGVEWHREMRFEQLEQAAAAVAVRNRRPGSRWREGLYIETRQVKAMLKESTNVVFGGERLGPTRKTAKSFVAERVFVQPDRIWLGATEPHGLDMTIGHIYSHPDHVTSSATTSSCSR